MRKAKEEFFKNKDVTIEYIEDRPYNDQRYYISNKKLKDLGWNIKVNLMDGLTSLLSYNTN